MPRPTDISIQEFSYDLPQDKIAVYPLEKRDEAKLLVYKNKKISEHIFKSISSFLEESSILVFNDTKVIRARLQFLSEKEQPIEVFCLEPESGEAELMVAMSVQRTTRWKCLVGNLKRWKQKQLKISKNNTELTAIIHERHDQYLIIEFLWEPSDLCFSEVLEVFGNTPIPPYLKRESEISDVNRYQTIYANHEGSVAAPTAGLHFTQGVFDDLKSKAINTVTVTLHVGAGTFKPVKSETMAGHDMHAEWIDVSIHTIKQLSENKNASVIAVGTTSLRTLESIYWMGLKVFLNKNATIQDLEIKQWEAYDLEEKSISAAQSLTCLKEWMESRGLDRLVCHTQILIAPPYQLKMAQGIITNFHQPQSTLLLLISAIIGEKWRDVYKYALENNFRFLSYGDSSLLLK